MGLGELKLICSSFAQNSMSHNICLLQVAQLIISENSPAPNWDCVSDFIESFVFFILTWAPFNLASAP